MTNLFKTDFTRKVESAKHFGKYNDFVTSETGGSSAIREGGKAEENPRTNKPMAIACFFAAGVLYILSMINVANIVLSPKLFTLLFNSGVILTFIGIFLYNGSSGFYKILFGKF